METITITLEVYKELIKSIKDLQETVTILGDRKKYLSREYIDSWEASRLLLISKKTLDRYRGKQKIPFFRMNKRIYFRLSDIEYYLYKQEEQHNNNQINE